MKIRWLTRFNDRDPGFVGDVLDSQGSNWISRGMAELYQEPVKAPTGPPRDKAMRRPRTKK